MTWTGDWIVPRQQGQPFLSRPPMENWLIAISARVHNSFSPSAVRTPAVLSVLLTTLLLYGYGRSFLGRVGAMTAAAGFCSMPEIMQMGRLAESDAIFAFFLGGSFLVWHWGWSQRWPESLTWGLAYLLMACATLTKGPQAPAYFAATIGIYLISSGQWRRLFSSAHFAGICVYLVAVGAWILPYWLEMGSINTWKIFTCDSTDRFVNLRWQDIVIHLLQYPLELAGCTAPWSCLLIAFASPRLRQLASDLNPHVRYLAIAILVSFPSCWITPGGQTRYMMPLYPCVAVLAGIVAERLPLASPRLQLVFAGARGAFTTLMIVTAFGMTFLTWNTDNPELVFWRQPPALATIYCLVAIPASIAVWRANPLSSPRLRFAGVTAIAGFLSLTYCGPILNQLCARSEHASDTIAALKQRLPEEVRLVSLGPIHHKFAYEFGKPIESVPENADCIDRIPPGGMFCYATWDGARRALPFASAEIAVISMDRNFSPIPHAEVIVAQRSSHEQKTVTTITQR